MPATHEGGVCAACGWRGCRQRPAPPARRRLGVVACRAAGARSCESYMLCVRVLHVMCLTCYMCHLTCYVCPAAWALLLLRAPRAPPVPHAAHCPMCVCHICVLSYLCLIRACPTLPRASRLSPCRRPSPTLSPTDPGPTARLALAPWRHCVSPSCSLPACRPWRASACVSYTDRGKTKTDALYVCLICVPYMCALNVCLICVPDMCALCELDTDGARPRQTVGGGLNGRPEKLPDVCYSWWILSALAIMRRLHWIDRLCPSAACAPLLPEPRCPLPPAGCYMLSDAVCVCMCVQPMRMTLIMTNML